MTKPVLRSVNGKNLVFAVSDSLSVSENVQTPSHTLCTNLKKYQDKIANANVEQLDAVMRDFATDLNGEMSVIASASSYKDYASSLALLTVNDGVATVTNIGTTSAFLMREGQLTPLASLASSKFSFKTATPSACGLIGNYRSGETVTPEISDSYEIVKNDVFLLCSDGLTSALTEQRISYILSLDLSDERLATRLVSEALARGAGDDITVMIIRNGAIPYSSPKKRRTALSLCTFVILLAVLVAFIASSFKSCSKKPDISQEGDIIVETASPKPEEFMSTEKDAAPTPVPTDDFVLRTPKP